MSERYKRLSQSQNFYLDKTVSVNGTCVFSFSGSLKNVRSVISLNFSCSIKNYQYHSNCQPSFISIILERVYEAKAEFTLVCSRTTWYVRDCMSPHNYFVDLSFMYTTLSQLLHWMQSTQSMSVTNHSVIVFWQKLRPILNWCLKWCFMIDYFVYLLRHSMTSWLSTLVAVKILFSDRRSYPLSEWREISAHMH